MGNDPYRTPHFSQENPANAERNTLLHVSSIIMIVLSILSLAGILLALLGFGALFGIFGFGAAGAVGLGVVGGIALIIALVTSLGSVLELIAGLLGLRGSYDPNRAKTCFVFGVIILGLAVLSLLMGDALTFGKILGLAVPAAYTLGASQVKARLK